jgi:hypothetical protein
VNFNILGPWSPDNNIDVEINHELTTGNECSYGMQNLLRSELLRDGTKCKIYKTLIKPAVLHGNESWTLTNLNEDKLKVF